MKFLVFAFIGLLAPIVLWAQVKTPDDLKVDDELPGPLGVYYEYSGKEADSLNVRIVNNRFRCYFLKDEKIIVEPDWPDAIVHYGNAVRKGLNRNTTLMRLAEDGSPYLVAVRIIPPPNRYWIQLVLQNEEDVEATNNPNQPAPQGAKHITFPTEILNQLPQQDIDDADTAVGNFNNNTPVNQSQKFINR